MDVKQVAAALWQAAREAADPLGCATGLARPTIGLGQSLSDELCAALAEVSGTALEKRFRFGGSKWWTEIRGSAESNGVGVHWGGWREATEEERAQFVATGSVSL